MRTARLITLSRPSRRLGAYGAMMGAAAFLGLAKYVLVARLLTTEALGYYGLVLIVLPFGVYLANFGVLHALNVRLPIMLGRRDPDADPLVHRSLGFVLLSTTATSSTYLAIVLLMSGIASDVRFALAMAAGTIALTTFSEFYIFVVRAQRRIERLAAISLTRATLAFTIGGLGAALASYRGLILGEFVALTVSIAVGAKLSGVRNPHMPRASETKALLIAGAPLVVADLVFALRFSLDRIFVASTLVDDLGQYTLASLVVVSFNVVLAIAYQAVAPQLLFEYGMGSDLLALRDRLRGILAKLLVASMTVALLLWPVVEWASDGFLEKYQDGLAITPVLYVGGILSLFSLYSTILLAAGRFITMMVISVASAALGLAGGLLVAVTAPSISHYAFIFVVTQLSAALGFVVVAERIARFSTPPTVRL